MKALSAVKKPCPLCNRAALQRAQNNLLDRKFERARARQRRFNGNGDVEHDPDWLIYPVLLSPGDLIHPSFVLVVCRSTGKVLYAGPAHDEAG